MPAEYETRYDEPGDTLTVKKKGSDIHKSVSFGNMNVDFDTDNKVVGIQLLNASEVLLFPEEIENPVKFLKNIQDAELRTKYFEDGSMALVALVKKQEDGQTMEGVLNTQTPAVTA